MRTNVFKLEDPKNSEKQLFCGDRSVIAGIFTIRDENLMATQ